MTAIKPGFSGSKNQLQIQPYKPGKPEEELMRELGLQRIIKLASNENCLGPSPLAVKAMKEAVTRVHRYPDGNGYYLRQALSKHLNVPDENIILGNGSTDLVEIIARAYLQPGENSITADHTFLMYRIATLTVNALCQCIPVVNYCYDLRGIAAAINDQTRIVFVANPNNPTGTMVSRSEIESFLSEIPSEVVVVIDEAYFEYVESADYPNCIEYLSQYPNLIILRTFSKIYGLAGIRIGYGIASVEIISHLNRFRSPFNTNAVAQAAGIAALNDIDQVNRSLKFNRDQRKYLTDALRKMNIPVVPSVTNFVLLPIDNAMPIYEALLQKGIIVRPMKTFNEQPGLRVTAGKQDENDAFLQELEKLV